jgi:DNA polymerase-3 subunit alpha
MISDQFVHLAIHSDMSITGKPEIDNFPGSARVPEFVARASELSQPAIAFTELASLRGIYAQTVECDKRGIKPIYGVEVYVCPNHKLGNIPLAERERIQASTPDVNAWTDLIDAYAIEHGYMQRESELTTLTLWALDDAGLKNLFALTSTAHINGFYYQPRVDIELIRKYSAGVACGTGGPNSYVMRPIVEGRRSQAFRRAYELSTIFGDRLYLEIRPHRLLPQSKANAFAIELATRKPIDANDPGPLGKLLATQLAHYINEGDLPNQKMLTAIVSGQRGASVDVAGLAKDSYWLRSRAEMLDAFDACNIAREISEQACDETLKFAELCSARLSIDPFAMILPDIDTGELSHIEHLRKLCSREHSDKWCRLHDSICPPPTAEFRDHPGHARWAEYESRLEHELGQLARPVSPTNPITFASYIVYVHEVVTMARELGIALGPGRGSSAGSLVNYLIGITDVDPIEHGLLFSRFIDPNRVGPPDVDVDCDAAKRPALLAAMRERWGADRVAMIATFGKEKGRRITDDVARELGIPRAEVNEVKKRIEQRADHDPDAFLSIRDAFVGTEEKPADPDCVKFAAKYPAFLPYALALEGCARSVGVHPAGIVIAPGPLMEYAPLEMRKAKKDGERVLVVAYDMAGVDQVGLLKVDMLGLKTITTIDVAIDAINRTHPGAVSWSSIPFDDTATLDAFTRQDLSGVFQYDTPSARKLCKGLNFSRFGILADLNALNRPGPLDSGMADLYLSRMKGETNFALDDALPADDYCPEVSAITSETFGIMVYQEQVMRIVAEIGQHDNPDNFRKIVGKKLRDKIEAERKPFVAGALETTSMGRAGANKLFDDILTFARYGFNKSHSVAYARLGQICQYLKVHYPLEFFWALLTTCDDDDRRHYARDAVSRGIKVAPPNVSRSSYTIGIDPERKAITGAISDVKGVGEKAAANIVANQPFSSFADFMARTDRRCVNSGVVKKLALAGALDELLPNVRWFVEHADELFHESKLVRFPGWEVALQSAEGPEYTAEEKLYNASSVNPMALESPYTKLLSSLAIELVDFGDPNFMEIHNGRSVWVAGSLADISIYNQTPYGDRTPTKGELAHESYMAPYAVASLDSDTGKRAKLKVPWHVYRERPIDTLDGAGVLTLARVDAAHDTLKASIVIPLETMRDRPPEQWQGVEELLAGRDLFASFPLDAYHRKLAGSDYAKLLRWLHTTKDENPILSVMGLVTEIRSYVSGKKDQEMAWVSVLTQSGELVDIKFFASDWIGGWDPYLKRNKVGVKSLFQVGSLVTIDVRSDEWQGKHSCLFSNMKVWKQ